MVTHFNLILNKLCISIWLKGPLSYYRVQSIKYLNCNEILIETKQNTASVYFTKQHWRKKNSLPAFSVHFSATAVKCWDRGITCLTEAFKSNCTGAFKRKRNCHCFKFLFKASKEIRAWKLELYSLVRSKRWVVA